MDSEPKDEPAETEPKRCKYGYLLLLLLCLVPVAVVLLVPSARAQVMQTLLDGGVRIRELHTVGYIVYLTLYVAWCAALLPQTAVELLAGWMFDLPVAILLASVSRTFATFVMCLLGRSIARGVVNRHAISKSQFLQALMVVVDRHPRKAAVLISVMTMPIWCKNYLWSVTAAPIWMMMMAQLVCVLPYSVFTVYIGHTSQNLIGVLTGNATLSSAQLVFSAASIVVGLAVLTMSGYYTKRELDRMIDEDVPAPSMVAMEHVEEKDDNSEHAKSGYLHCPSSPDGLTCELGEQI